MLRHDYWNQWPEVILGAEGDGADGDEGNDSDDDSDDENSDDDGADGGNGSDSSNQPTAEDIAKLQEALTKERRANKRLTRENNRIKSSQSQDESQKLTELEEARNREQAANSQVEKLAAGLLRRDLNAAIERAAREEKFLDVTDAIDGVDRTKIVYDQDDEDPTDIEIDENTVKSAVKALAAKKPHFISRGTDDGEPSGSPFGGSKKKKKSDEQSMREIYPSL